MVRTSNPAEPPSAIFARCDGLDTSSPIENLASVSAAVEVTGYPPDRAELSRTGCHIPLEHDHRALILQEQLPGYLVGGFKALLDHGRNPYCNAVRGHIPHHYGVGSDDNRVADRDVPDYLGARIEDHIIPNHRVS